MSELPRRILIVRLGAIGDVVNALVLAGALKQHDPSVEIGWAVHGLAEPLVRAHPWIERVHLWQRKAGAARFRALLRELRGARYELAIDLQRIAKSALLARLSGAPRVLGFDRARAKEQSWLLTRERLPAAAPGAPAHMVEQYLEFARYLGLPTRPARHALPRDAAAERWAEQLCAQLPAPPLLLNVGASKPANRWPGERFGALALELVRCGLGPVCLTGGAGDREHAAAALAACASESGVRDLVGATTLAQYAALARRARLYVGCDTGPMHIAAAVGTRCIALFGPADERRTGPWPPDRHRVLRAPPPPCAPCHRRSCNQPRHACMLDLDLGQVVAAVREAWSADAPAS